jgi:hypothetical protein
VAPQQAVGHQAVTPLQVTCPCSVGQDRSAVVHELVPVQLTDPDPQLAVALQFARKMGASARPAPSGAVSQEPALPVRFRLANNGMGGMGAASGAWAKAAVAAKARTKIMLPILFILDLLVCAAAI